MSRIRLESNPKLGLVPIECQFRWWPPKPFFPNHVSPWHVGNLYFWGNMTVTFWLSIGFRGMFRQCHMQRDCWALVEHQLNYQNRLLKTCWYLQRIYLPIPYHQDLLPSLSLSPSLSLFLCDFTKTNTWKNRDQFCICSVLHMESV